MKTFNFFFKIFFIAFFMLPGFSQAEALIENDEEYVDGSLSLGIRIPKISVGHCNDKGCFSGSLGSGGQWRTSVVMNKKGVGRTRVNMMRFPIDKTLKTTNLNIALVIEVTGGLGPNCMMTTYISWNDIGGESQKKTGPCHEIGKVDDEFVHSDTAVWPASFTFGGRARKVIVDYRLASPYMFEGSNYDRADYWTRSIIDIIVPSIRPEKISKWKVGDWVRYWYPDDIFNFTSYVFSVTRVTTNFAWLDVVIPGKPDQLLYKLKVDKITGDYVSILDVLRKRKYGWRPNTVFSVIDGGISPITKRPFKVINVVVKDSPSFTRSYHFADEIPIFGYIYAGSLEVEDYSK